MTSSFCCVRCAENFDIEYEAPLTPLAKCDYCTCSPSFPEVQLALTAKWDRSLVLDRPRSASEPIAPAGDTLTAAEVETIYRFPSRQAVYAAVRRGDIPVQRLGKRRMRFSRRAIEAAMAAKAKPNPHDSKP
jgi:predicted DNA-binding transcriptional regulator AlpA